jgi:hypothetical protein
MHPIICNAPSRHSTILRLFLILSLILVNLEISQRVGVFGGSDDTVASVSELFNLYNPSQGGGKSRSSSVRKTGVGFLNGRGNETYRSKFSKLFFFKCFLVRY